MARDVKKIYCTRFLDVKFTTTIKMRKFLTSVSRIHPLEYLIDCKRLFPVIIFQDVKKKKYNYLKTKQHFILSTLNFRPAD